MSFLTDVCSIQYGYPFDSALFNSNDGTPLVRIRDVVPGFSNTYTTEKCDECYYVENDDMLIGMDGEFNIAYWKGGHAYLNQRVCKIIPKEGVHKRYLFYQLMPILKRIENRTAFVTVKHLSAKELNKIELSLPDFPRQQRIADTLDKVSEGIGLCRKMLGKLDLMVKAKFVEMFGDPVSNEREWNVETLNDVCTEIGDGLHGTPEYDDNGEYPFINGNNLINGAIEITPATKKVNAEIYKKHYIDISANALLLSINGTLGKLAFYNGEKVMLGKSACYCNFKPEINRAFVYGVMKTEAFAGFLEKSATASTIKNVGLKAIRGYKLIMPPQALQMQFIEFSNQVDKSKLAVKQSLEKLETLKKSLMQERSEERRVGKECRSRWSPYH